MKAQNTKNDFNDSHIHRMEGAWSYFGILQSEAELRLQYLQVDIYNVSPAWRLVTQVTHNHLIPANYYAMLLSPIFRPRARLAGTVVKCLVHSLYSDVNTFIHIHTKKGLKGFMKQYVPEIENFHTSILGLVFKIIQLYFKNKSYIFFLHLVENVSPQRFL